MTTVNISLPDQLKNRAQELVAAGFYASLSDLVRASLRTTIEKSKYDLWADEAEEDLRKGKGVLINSKEELEDYFKKL